MKNYPNIITTKIDKVTLINDCEYVLATKWRDGNPADQWAIGFVIGMLGDDRYMVVDSEGKPFRTNGFRRVKRISATRGTWILEHKHEIESATRSLWWWVRQKMIF